MKVGSKLISPIEAPPNQNHHQKHQSLLESLPIHPIKEESMRKLQAVQMNENENKYDDDGDGLVAQIPNSKPRASMVAGHRYIPSFDSAVSPDDAKGYIAWSDN